MILARLRGVILTSFGIMSSGRQKDLTLPTSQQKEEIEIECHFEGG